MICFSPVPTILLLVLLFVFLPIEGANNNPSFQQEDDNSMIANAASVANDEQLLEQQQQQQQQQQQSSPNDLWYPLKHECLILLLAVDYADSVANPGGHSNSISDMDSDSNRLRSHEDSQASQSSVMTTTIHCELHPEDRGDSLHRIVSIPGLPRNWVSDNKVISGETTFFAPNSRWNPKTGQLAVSSLESIQVRVEFLSWVLCLFLFDHGGVDHGTCSCNATYN